MNIQYIDFYLIKKKSIVIIKIIISTMRTKLFFFVIMFIGIAGYAQQDAQYTQYMYNTININPAYAGSRGALSIFGLYRTQWVGLDGAPETSSFSVNTHQSTTAIWEWEFHW